MRRHGVRRVVAQTSYGVGESRAYLPLGTRVVFRLLLAPQIADTEAQADVLHASGLDWVEVQPVNLTDDDVAAAPFTSAAGEVGELKVSRRQVGRLLADAVETDAYVGRTVAVSAATREHAPAAP